MSAPPAGTLHATAVAIDGRAVLLTGPSGSGKSDLALRLIDRGAVLIADDRVLLDPSPAGLRASAPARIAGMIEVRGIGIHPLPFVADVPVALVVEATDAPPRMPETTEHATLSGHPVPLARLCFHEPSAPIKIEILMRGTAR